MAIFLEKGLSRCCMAQNLNTNSFSSKPPVVNRSGHYLTQRSPGGNLCTSHQRFCTRFVAHGYRDEYPAPQTKQISITLDGKDRQLIIETGGIGRQANGSVMARHGDTVIFTTVCCKPDPRSKEMDFIPLTVDYVEKLSSVGRTAMGFIKRERQRDHEILISRLIDRSIRPLFPDGWSKETQVLETVMSYDGVNSVDPLAITAAGAALAVSDIPFTDIVVGVRVGWIDGPIINPTADEQDKSELDLVLAGTTNAVVMLEGSGSLILEENFIKAFDKGVEYLKEVSKQISDWAHSIGKTKMTDGIATSPQELESKLWDFTHHKLDTIFDITNKQERNKERAKLWGKIMEHFRPLDQESEYTEELIKNVYKRCESKHLRKKVSKGIRIDGRRPEDIRPIYCSANILPRTHGSATFTRGHTQALCVATLGSQKAAQMVESLQEVDLQRFYLQYFFPPSSVGEVRRFTLYPGRREIGHGELASRALTPAVPEIDEFPYTIRLESTITESDGSSSMASVCGGYLAMMDAGVPMKTPIAGIAMGLMFNDDKSDFVALSDIIGTEDALGDLDLKVAGSVDGISAVQMDVKVKGLSPDVLLTAFRAAKDGRRHIIEEMEKCAPPTRNVLSAFAPHIKVLQIDQSLVGRVIGTGGKVVRGIQEVTKVQSIRVEDNGEVEIIGKSFKDVEETERLIHLSIGELSPGQVIKRCLVSGIKDFGAFVDIAPGRTGLLHISEISVDPILKVEDALKIGERIDVQVLSTSRNGRCSLSRKALLLQQQGIEIKTQPTQLLNPQPISQETIKQGQQSSPVGHKDKSGIKDKTLSGGEELLRDSSITQN